MASNVYENSNLNMSQLWGEFEDPEPKDSVPAEIVKYIIMQAMQKDPLRSPPPHEKQIIKSDPEPAGDSTGLDMDDRVIHSVKLIKYSRDMHDFIDDQQNFQMGQNLAKPELPEHPIPPAKHPFNYPLQFIDKNYSDFSQGIGPILPAISTDTAKNLLNKAVALLLVHNGFDRTSHSVLATFTDAVEFFMRRITLLMRVSVERGANDGITGFPDAMERVFSEMGLGSLRSLHDFYQKNVVQRHKALVEECEALDEEYAGLAPQIKSEMSFLQKEERDEVPEIHLNDLAGDDGFESANALETGYQMLQSFEQEVRSQEEGNESTSLDNLDFSNYKRIKL